MVADRLRRSASRPEEDRLGATIAAVDPDRDPRLEEASEGQERQPIAEAEKDLVQAYLNEIGNHPLLEPEAERELAQRVRAGDDAARDELVGCNLKLVVSLARAFKGRGLGLMDLVQEGNRGLMTATERFDPDKGFRFSTYARWWIRQAMHRACHDQGRVIRLPVHVHEKLRRARQEAEVLTRDLGRDPEPEELAECCDLSPDALVEYWKAGAATLSLDRPAGDDEDGRRFLEWLPADGDDPEDQAVRAADRHALQRAMASLEYRDQVILRHRFGLDDCERMTLVALGKKLGITRERTRQLERRALVRLRQVLEEQATRGVEAEG